LNTEREWEEGSKQRGRIRNEENPKYQKPPPGAKSIVEQSKTWPFVCVLEEGRTTFSNVVTNTYKIMS